MFVRIKKADKRLGTKAGEVYEAARYWLDPMSKVTLIARVPDGYDPSCNEYIYNVEIITKAEATQDRQP